MLLTLQNRINNAQNWLAVDGFKKSIYDGLKQILLAGSGTAISANDLAQTLTLGLAVQATLPAPTLTFDKIVASRAQFFLDTDLTGAGSLQVGDIIRLKWTNAANITSIANTLPLTQADIDNVSSSSINLQTAVLADDVYSAVALIVRSAAISFDSNIAPFIKDSLEVPVLSIPGLQTVTAVNLTATLPIGTFATGQSIKVDYSTSADMSSPTTSTFNVQAGQNGLASIQIPVTVPSRAVKYYFQISRNLAKSNTANTTVLSQITNGNPIMVNQANIFGPVSSTQHTFATQTLANAGPDRAYILFVVLNVKSTVPSSGADGDFQITAVSINGGPDIAVSAAERFDSSVANGRTYTAAAIRVTDSQLNGTTNSAAITVKWAGINGHSTYQLYDALLTLIEVHGGAGAPMVPVIEQFTGGSTGSANPATASQTAQTTIPPGGKAFSINATNDPVNQSWLDAVEIAENGTGLSVAASSNTTGQDLIATPSVTQSPFRQHTLVTFTVRGT